MLTTKIINVDQTCTQSLKKDSSSKSFLTFYLIANFTEKFHRKKVHMFTSDPFESQGTGVCTKASPLLLVGWSRCSPRCVVSLSLSQFGGQDSQVRGRLKHGECWRWVFFKAWCFFRSWNLKRFFSCGGGGKVWVLECSQMGQNKNCRFPIFEGA